MTESTTEAAESLDPRVQIELECLNTCTDEINRLELALDEARLVFRQILAEGNIKLQQLGKKHGNSVHKARPYYEARFAANISQQALQTATQQYEKANSALLAAKEMMFLAEQGLSQLGSDTSVGVSLDPAWQEMLNHATEKVNEAERSRAEAVINQNNRLNKHRSCAAIAYRLQHDLKRYISKSRPYFEEKARINSRLDSQKSKIQSLETSVGNAKLAYSRTLRSLETISDEIHKHRHNNGMRCNGVRARSPASSMQSTPRDKSDENLTVTSNNHTSSSPCRSPAADSLPSDLLSPLDKPQISISPVVRGTADGADSWTEISLDATSPGEESLDRCSSYSSQPSSPSDEQRSNNDTLCRVSADSPRRIITRRDSIRDRLRVDVAAWINRSSAKSEESIRRPSLDLILNDKAEKVKEMFTQGMNIFSSNSSERRGSGSERDDHSDTDSLASLEMLSEDQIASLMLDRQLEAMCTQLMGATVAADTPA